MADLCTLHVIIIPLPRTEPAAGDRSTGAGDLNAHSQLLNGSLRIMQTTIHTGSSKLLPLRRAWDTGIGNGISSFESSKVLRFERSDFHESERTPSR